MLSLSVRMENHHEESYIKVALSATLHCLLGCGLGDVIGMSIGIMIGFSYYKSIGLGIIFGFVLGYLLGILPITKNGIDLKKATKIVLATEFFSILFMEIGEAVVEILSPGMRRMGPLHLGYWFGLGVILFVGFCAALPVNFYLVGKGVRHQH